MTKRVRPLILPPQQNRISQRPRHHGRHEEIRFFTIDEVAEMLRIATRTVRRRVDARELIAHRIGGAVRIAESDLRAFLAVQRDG